eukprot:6201641-Pleurochrysis_carterae.AAC.7
MFASSGAASLSCRLSRCSTPSCAAVLSSRSLDYALFATLGFGIPDGGGAGTLGTLTLSQSWSGFSPEPDRVRGVFGY